MWKRLFELEWDRRDRVIETVQTHFDAAFNILFLLAEASDAAENLMTVVKAVEQANTTS